MKFEKMAIIISLIVSAILISSYWKQGNIEAVLGYVLAVIWMLICHAKSDNKALKSDVRKLSERCQDCKEEFGHPDNCVECPHSPAA